VTSIVIFAAGRGSRLGASVPKFVVEVESRPIFVHQLEALRDVQGEVYIVCGYRASLLVQLMLADLPEGDALRSRLTFVFNDRYREPQRESIRRALSVIPQNRPALFIDGDMIFGRDTVMQLARSSVTTLVLRKVPSADGVMAQLSPQGTLVQFVRGGIGEGEWGNLVLYHPSELAALASEAANPRYQHHFDLLNSLATQGHAIHTTFAQLAEVDDISDLVTAAGFIKEAPCAE
jgi:CTP:molybdopterin cytidylyltransferase MocA